VDLVTLDLEMPQMGGLEALRAIQRLNAARPDVPPVGVLLVSAHTSEGAAVTIEALEAGAFDFVTKPAAGTPEEALAYLRQQLQAKVRLFRTRRGGPAGAGNTTGAAAEGEGGRTRLSPAPPRGSHRVRAILVGVSTGGPRALAELLPELTERVAAPVFVVQHMPAGFTTSLANSLARKCRVPVIEAVNGQIVEGRTVHIAPGNRHLLVRRQGEGVVTLLNEQPAQNGFRPSADVLFRSAAAAYGSDAVGILLTGMSGGGDGTQGIGALKRAGAHTIAQDEASSVVWGMPGSAVAAGHIDQVLPLSRIAAAVQALGGSRGGPPDGLAPGQRGGA
jgi:two-component system chemotaxis response regulator CheB